MNTFLLCGLSLAVAYLAFLVGANNAALALPAVAAVIVAGSIASFGAVALIRQARHHQRAKAALPEGEPNPSFSLGYGVAAILFSALLVVGAVESIIAAA